MINAFSGITRKHIGDSLFNAKLSHNVIAIAIAMECINK